MISLAGLIAPLQWVCPLITLLPRSLENALSSPVPILAGVSYTIADEHARESDTVYVDLLKDEVRLHGDMYHDVKPPLMDQLFNKLRLSSEKVYSKGRVPLFSPSQDQAPALTNIVAEINKYFEGIVNAAVQLPKPKDMGRSYHFDEIVNDAHESSTHADIANLVPTEIKGLGKIGYAHIPFLTRLNQTQLIQSYLSKMNIALPSSSITKSKDSLIPSYNSSAVEDERMTDIALSPIKTPRGMGAGTDILIFLTCSLI